MSILHQKLSISSEIPFEQLHSNLPTINGRNFLIIKDQYSCWPDVIPFPNKNTTARPVVNIIINLVSQMVLSNLLCLDNK